MDTTAPTEELFAKLAQLREQHQRRVEALGIDFDGIARAYSDARRDIALKTVVPVELEAVVPPAVMARLYAWTAEVAAHSATTDALMGYDRPDPYGGAVTERATLFGVPAVIEVTDSGDVEFRPVASRSR